MVSGLAVQKGDREQELDQKSHRSIRVPALLFSRSLCSCPDSSFNDDFLADASYSLSLCQLLMRDEIIIIQGGDESQRRREQD